MHTSFLHHPKSKAFSVVLLIELWERFGFYGMQSILVLFLSKYIKLGDHNANLLIGSFAAMTYIAPILGGWIGDSVIGNKRAMISGSVTLALGYLLLAFATHHTDYIYISMAVISTGNGLFKPNAATLVRRIYEDNDSQLDVAFTLYYMAVNVGSTLSMFLCPILKDIYGWDAAFIACFIGLFLGIVNYFITQNRLQTYLPPKDQQPVSIKTLFYILGMGIICIIAITFILHSAFISKLCVWLTALLVLILWAYIYVKTNPNHRIGLRIMYILTIEGMLFYIFYQQIFTSLTLFAERNVDLSLNIGPYHLFTWRPGQFQLLNPIWIMIISPILSKIYTYLAQKNGDFSIATKFVGGFILIACSFLLWWIICIYSTTDYISSWSMIWGYGLLSFGELLTSGLGLAVIARYVPTSMNGFMTGSYFINVGIAMYIGSQIANIAAPLNINMLSAHQTLALYQHLFFSLFIMAVIAILCLLCLIPVLKKLNQQYKALIH